MTKKLRKSAKGQDCMIRIPGVCNFNQETTVLAHFNGGGMGRKKPDLLGSFSCSNCHDAVDRRTHVYLEKDWLELCFRQGNERTIQWWLDNGYINV